MYICDYHWAWTAPSVWSTCWGVLKHKDYLQISRVVYTHLCLFRFRGRFTLSLMCLGFCLLFFVCLSLLALVIMYDRERMSSLWIRRSWCFKHLHYIMHFGSEYSVMKCFKRKDFISSLFLCKNMIFIVLMFIVVICQTVVFDSCVLVPRCRRRYLWGGASGGGGWATASPWVAAQRRQLDVGWVLEFRPWRVWDF